MEKNSINGSLLYAAKDPYPTVQIEVPNCTYGKIMLDNIGGRNSELTAVNSYFYNNITSDDKEIAYAFHKISIVEMHHLSIFAQFARLLGEDPRLWVQHENKCYYWSASFLEYPSSLKEMLTIALREEELTICNYQKQAAYIEDPYICNMLQRIILDEQIHVTIFKSFLDKYCKL